ncbi:MAG: carbon-nitrogen hydrolase [Peredibacter sp.]|nr:carbon-nitrogen hydrolase [Peredibacter sp.]|tara:strand:+ start:4214 stop:5755 length:1542 start_codon:yes stop_codon:yes gene_type:complete
MKKNKAQLLVRQARSEDVPEIINLNNKVYPNLPPYPPEMILGQITNYAEGCMVVELNGNIVAYSASIRLSEKKVKRKHTWNSVTGGGFGTTHEKDGEFLYGYEIFVDPEQRGQRIGQRIYNARKELVKHYRLKGIVFAGRIPNYRKRHKRVANVEEYIEKVKNKTFRDPALGFQLRNGFEVLGVLKNYLPDDKESMGNAVHLMWLNPEYNQDSLIKGQPPQKNVVRLATVQFQQRKIKSFEEFSEIVRYFVDVSSNYNSDFVVFPEYFTMQLLSIDNEEVKPHVAIERMTEYADDVKSLLRDLAIKYNINIIGGSHPSTMKDGSIKNISYICLRNGELHEQAKIHPTPDEAYWWNIQGGDKIKVIPTDCGPIGVLICYDSEFPELTRHLVNQGIQILFVPFMTDERQSYLRVRYCCQARAVENQIYVVMSGNVGNLPKVSNMDIQYAQSCILTPCDFPFSRDGIAADTTPNVETVAFADLRLDALLEARNNGTVQNLKDRRHDLYSVKWHNSK